MRYLAAYLLLTLGGKTPDAKAIKSLLGSVGIDADDERLNAVIKELGGKNVEELIAEGQSKLASVPAGGAVAAGGAAAGGAGGAAAAPAEEEKKEEEEEESDEDMGFGLFD